MLRWLSQAAYNIQGLPLTTPGHRRTSLFHKTSVMGGVCSSPTAALVTSQAKNSAYEILDIKEETFEGQLLTARQLKVVEDTWALLDNDQSGRGVRVFLRIFTLAPEAKGLFNFRHIPDSELTSNHLFKAHAGRFMQVVCSVIQNINDLDTQLKPTLHNLGKAHVLKYSVSLDYFDLFKTAMLTVWDKDLGPAFTVEARQAWTIVFDYILQEMKVGFLSANQNHAHIIIKQTDVKDADMAETQQVAMVMNDDGSAS